MDHEPRPLPLEEVRAIRDPANRDELTLRLTAGGGRSFRFSLSPWSLRRLARQLNAEAELLGR